MRKTIDEKEFLERIRINRGVLFKICNIYCVNREDREDLAQEIVYQLWRSGASFDDSYRFSTWMYRVALNVAISYYRNTKRDDRVVSLSEWTVELENRTTDDDGDDDMERNRQLLYSSINELNAMDRMLILLSLEEKKYSEIAEIAGISETNVATRLNRIREKLKQKITQQKD